MNGLSLLSGANELVESMQEELVNLGPKIEEKAKVTKLIDYIIDIGNAF